MSDIKERLRSLGREHDDFSIGVEAADDIERLEAKLAEAQLTAWDAMILKAAKAFILAENKADSMLEDPEKWDSTAYGKHLEAAQKSMTALRQAVRKAEGEGK